MSQLTTLNHISQPPFFFSLSPSSSSILLIYGSVLSPPTATMKTQRRHPKLKAPLFSCAFFRHCTQTVLSPTTPHPPSLLPPQSDQLSLPPPQQAPSSPSSQSQPIPPVQSQTHDSSSTSSSSTSQSFTQWRFPLTNSPLLNHPPPPCTQPSATEKPSGFSKSTPLFLFSNLEELFHISELQLKTGSDPDKIATLQLLERSLVPNPQPENPVCPPELMREIIKHLKNRAGAKSSAKILLALCLSERNRHVAVEVRAAGEVVEAVMEMEGSAAERALAALELMCTVAEGAAEVRSHALTVPVMVEMMGRLEGFRGKEYAISVLAVVFGGGGCGDEVAAPPEEVARAVELALQGECSARGRRKAVQLLKVLNDFERLDVGQDES